VVAGAYRCPNCGIDFPTGTPGTPRAAQSPADPDEGSARAEVPPSTVNLAERLESALGELTAPPPVTPPPSASPASPSATPRAASPRATAEVIDIVPEPADDDREPRASAELRTVPGADREGRAEPTLGPPGDPGRRSVDLTVAPKRGSAAPLVAEPEPRAVVPVRRRRRSRGLGATVVTAVLLLVLVGAGAWWINERGVAESITSALVPGVAAPEPLTVGADAGWVSVPSELGTVQISGDGPFRVRVGGEVYTVQPADTLRVAGAEGQSVAVRAIRAPTTVRVTPEG
jgi:hypothetical protein